MGGKSGIVIVVVAPSGTGKTTLINRLKAEFPQIKESISYTTRYKRSGEVSGEQYFFISKEEFENKIRNDDFLEWAIVHENYYGTSKQFLFDQIQNGNFVLCDIDVQGADNVKKYFKDQAQVIFISPPSLEVLRQRLEGRKTESQDIIEIRLRNAKKEIQRKDDYDYLVVNDDLDQAFYKLKEVIHKIIGDKN
ncbi:MAG: guanylate kinase [Bdellovibrionales bacterium RIFOXYB1_FULL_37_110]|nr:MAG: guanylate kinase [Bdellovibrionales bacterium RIFOXYC1_FULL_37_79]OFZ54042.1 MAG: guanylate kinase [Bdellovibrionales bacterium RIFOXYB2_FULL_36_6]OFZ59207.1 MAG: guanylate kinase [Bdellovibrionales bacterium RIFOXYB1_FULL_37_110]OFZ62833.1 MAG: guanylate kinase [Bdellovibrionales bacterium RIFOXYD1_FULL_36_51]